MNWLNKWDEFRQIKMQFVDKALELMKRNRRIINLLSLMTLIKFIRGIQDNYLKLREHNMQIWAKIIIACKLKVRY